MAFYNKVVHSLTDAGDPARMRRITKLWACAYDICQHVSSRQTRTIYIY